MKLGTRKNIYSLLFSKPLFDYAICNNAGKININVLIAGDDEDCIEAFKAVYWCGQLSERYCLNISIMSSSPKECEASLLNDMPALGSRAVHANIIFLNKESELNPNEYGYCFLSNEYASLVEIIRSKNDNALLCAFFDSSFTVEKKENIVYLNSENLFFEEKELLDSYAFNCDFAYRMGEDERCTKGILSDFVKPESSDDYYNYLSSLSFPVHIPYKIRICADESPDNVQPIQTLMHAIKEKGALYNILLENEHRRWTAYMISEGWRMPTDEELQSYAFSNYGYAGGYDQRDKKNLLHPCICKGSDKGCRIDDHNEIWRTIERSDLCSAGQIKTLLANKYPMDVFSELEVTTLALYGIVCNRAKETYPKVDKLFYFIDKLDQSDSRNVYESLRQATRKLINNEINASKIYFEALIEAKHWAKNDNLQKEISKIENTMKIFVEKNKQKNYFTIDSTMIDMIPFCIWYGRENRTIITVSAGLALEDVITPTILCAETAVFIEKERSAKYEDAIKSYFYKSRRKNTNAVFYKCALDNQDDIIASIRELLNRYDSPAINCVSGNNAATIMSIGALADSCNIPVFSYSYTLGIENIKNGNLISPGLNKKTLSVDEMVLLMGGNYTNILSEVPYIRQLYELEQIFIKYSEEKTYFVNGKRKTFSAWSALSNLFQSASKNLCPDIVGDYRRSHFKASFDKQIFSTCGLQYFLPLLNKYCIISDYVVKNDKDDSKDYVYVRFDYYDSGLADLLLPFTQTCCSSNSAIELCKKKRLSFSTSSGISLMSLVAENAQLCSPGEHKEMTATKVHFIKELEEKGFIHDLRISADNSIASLEFCNFIIKNIFMNQGKLFELLLYYKIRNSGLFDDVQTGVEIAWSPVMQSLDDAICEYLKTSGKHGYNIFMKAKKEIYAERQNISFSTSTDNEIDIVMTSGMSPIFVSCKTAKKGGNEWLYEIACVSDHFMARPVLAMTKNLDLEASNVLLSRARRMNVSVIGYETIFDNTRLLYALDCISKGIVIMGPDTNQQSNPSIR